MRSRRTGLWALAAASFALMAWHLLPFPERPHPEQSAPAHSASEGGEQDVLTPSSAPKAG